MKLILFTISLFACHSQDNIQSEIVIPDESYRWDCFDRQDESIIIMTAQYCNSQVVRMKTELSFNEGYIKDFELQENHECLWESEFEMIEEVCIQITNVTVVGINES